MVCKYWQQGKCKYQNNCSFAHSETEVRNKNEKGNGIYHNKIIFLYYLKEIIF